MVSGRDGRIGILGCSGYWNIFMRGSELFN